MRKSTTLYSAGWCFYAGAALLVVSVAFVGLGTHGLILLACAAITGVLGFALVKSRRGMAYLALPVALIGANTTYASTGSETLPSALLWLLFAAYVLAAVLMALSLWASRPVGQINTPE